MKNPLKKILSASALALALTSVALADRVELTNGSVIVGKILSAEAGKFKVETEFAGTVEIKQDKIKSFTTDEMVNVALAGGSDVLGQVTPTEAGIKVAATNGEMTAETQQVKAVWRKDAESPSARVAREFAEKSARKWAYEASLAITGRTGSSEKVGATAGLKATLASAQDKLIFAVSAERAEDNGVTTADRQFGGVDYSAFFTPKMGWYARTSLEKDAIKALDLRSTSAAGLTRKLLHQDREDLEFRLGVSYLYETYADNTKFSSPGLDVGFLNTYTFGNAKLSSTLTYTPAFKDFGNYRIHHESSLEMPLTAAMWKLKLGLTNDYQSIPPAGVERLDTLYFTSLILNWQ
jgi:hypothetical protein